MPRHQEPRAMLMLSKEWLLIKKINKTLLQHHRDLQLEILAVAKHKEMAKTHNPKLTLNSYW